MSFTKEQAHEKIEELINKFDLNYKHYNSLDYNETQTRIDFINPFFEAFNWDTSNVEGFSDEYREVIHEDKIKVGKETKAPDYSFRIGGNRVFFLEAKKPSVNIEDDVSPAYQLRRYGWSANLDISILTDFQEFAIYDCTKKPNQNDKASVARIEYINYKDYLNKFDLLWNILNKDSIQKGSLKKYSSTIKDKKGTSEVDVEFLKLLDELRKILAVDISKSNKDLSEEDINYAVQQTIDRIIFFRIAEDRKIEKYGTLRDACSTGSDCYKKMLEIFKKADERYNSGLFDFEKDTVSTRITISDKVLKKDIIERLYYPNCEYEFSIIPIEILGSAYEQFLGKVIRITPSHQAKIEYKEEVRKAGGVYYTPEYIVDYIIENTLGVMLKGKSVAEAKKIKILDPACGSGSFLLGAYKYLLNWYKTEYSKTHKLGKGGKDDVFTPAGELTNKIKKEILVNNIYGVDIDVNAVEVSKLSLLLKCLENETEATLDNTMSLFGERALPTLDENIVSGNSLIDIDFHDGELDFKELKKIKPFSFKSQFKHVFDDGGFDIVIGNPPYVQLQKDSGNLANMLEKCNYKVFSRTGDIYMMFFEKAFRLLKEGGLNGFITSNKWMRAAYGEALRDFLSNQNPLQLIDLGAGVFSGATVDTVITVIEKGNSKNKLKAITMPPIKKEENLQERLTRLKLMSIEKPTRNVWTIINKTEQNILSKIETKGKKLKDWDIQINYGIKTGYNEAFIIDEETKAKLIKEDKKSAEIIKPLLRGRDIKRYSYNFSNLYIIGTFPALQIKINEYPAIEKYLRSFGKRLSQTGKSGCRKKTNNKWFETQDTIAYHKEFENEKIVWTPVNSEYRFTYLPSGYYFNNSLFMITGENIKYLCAILNSKFLIYYFNVILAGENYNYGSEKTISQTPIPEPDKKIEEQIVKLVDTLLETYKLLNEEKLEQNKRILQGKIEYAEKKIDEIVYSLYGLSEEEMKVVEGE